MRRLSPLAVAAWLTAAPLGISVLGTSCEDDSYRPIGVEVNILTRSTDDKRLAAAQEKLLRYGPRAIPQLENALHAATEKARLRLIGTLAAMGHREAVPVLRHLAVYDPSAEVRQLCESTLRGWAVRAGDPGDHARAALTRVGQLRAAAPGP